MTTHTHNVSHTGKVGIGRIFGICFIALCVFAVVLNVGLPYGSSAASAPIVFSPNVDVAVAQATPTNAAPTSGQLLAVGGTSQRQSFIRFTVGGLSAGAAIQSAKLRLVVTNDSTGNTIFSSVSSNSWPESINWNTKPAIDGPPIAKLPAVTLNQIVEVDLTPAIKGAGTYSFAITSDPANLNTVAFASRENSAAANRPQLLITLSSGTAGSQPGATATPVNPTSPPTAPTATAVPPSQTGCQPLYSASSPWNTKIAANQAYDGQSAYHITALAGSLSSDPTQYTYPVYEVNSNTPLRTVKIAGAFSNVVDNDTRTIWQSSGTVQVPIPAGAQQSVGSDGNLVIWNRQTGDEWGFWKTSPNADGTWNATNGYHYNTNWDGVPPTNSSHFVSRGAGVPYLVGLVRPCEIAQGHIDHAIAFAYDYPSGQFVYPATKSDGTGSGPDMPEGARLQLDPQLTDAQIKAWGCTGNCLVIAHALQQYGMIVIDRSGRPKLVMEYEGTAKWAGAITYKTVSSIPFSAFKVLPLK